MKTSPLSLITCLFLAILAACSPVAAALPTSQPTHAPSPTLSDLPPTNTANPVTLNVFAAASLTAVFTHIGQLFEASHPGVHVTLNFAGSQTLVQQISAGAPADVFASAAQKQIDDLANAGRIDPGSVSLFAKNRLVVVVPQSNPGAIQSLQDLARPGLKIVLAAQAVPVGQYALDFLGKAAADPTFDPAYTDNVIKNVVSYEENVKSVLIKVALGEADAGIVYSTDLTPDVSAKVTHLTIPDALNVIATYPIVPLRNSPNAALAQTFIAAVLSPAGQAILTQSGFLPPK